MGKLIFYMTILVAMTVNGFKKNFFSQSLDSEPSISILYARDKKSDVVTNECLAEMYPRNLYKYPLRIDRNDIPCIIHCVLKKFGIMTNDGYINIKNYYRRVQAIHRYDPRILISDVGETCAQNINGMNLEHDVCKKAKVFNDCTQLYAVSYADPDDWMVVLILLAILTTIQARISVMYAHDKASDIIADQCLNEMYPRSRKIEVQESDESCIIYCVLKKFGIISSTGVINLDAYRKRVYVAHQLDHKTAVNDYGASCIESAEATQHKQDVCRKAKVFNDCTHLYRILLK